MPLLRNYWLRWFFFTFAIGSLIPLGIYAYSAFLTWQLMNSLPRNGVPIVIVSNPFIDFTPPGGKPVPISPAAFSLIVGTTFGLAGLILAALIKLARNPSCNFENSGAAGERGKGSTNAAP